jgi:hypothetical protein
LSSLPSIPIDRDSRTGSYSILYSVDKNQSKKEEKKAQEHPRLADTNPIGWFDLNPSHCFSREDRLLHLTLIESVALLMNAQWKL